MRRVEQMIGMDDARDGQAGNNRAYVVRAAILAAMLALVVALLAGSAEALPCDPIRDPVCAPDDGGGSDETPGDPSYAPTPGGFSWGMPPRYPGLNSAGVTDFSNYDPNFVQANTFRVNFNGCASEYDRNAEIAGDTNFTYIWSFPGSEGSPTTVEARSCKVPRTYRQGTYSVTLTILNTAGATLGTFEKTVTVKDKLIVAIGDSYGSGEGNPDKPQTYDFFGFVTAGPKWADKR